MADAQTNMLELVPHTLTGKRVRIERLTAAHADGLLAIGRDAEIWRHLSRAPLNSRADAEEYIRSAQIEPFGEGPQQAFAVIDLPSGQVAGTSRYLDMRPDHRGLEIGWTWYGLRYQRTAVNTESKLLLLTHAFEAMRCIRVYFKTDLNNERSQRAIERIGGQRQGVMHNHRIRPDGTYRHSVFYAILEDEWLQVKARLSARLSSASGANG